MTKETPTYWVTNVSNRNVSLADLNLTIPAFRSVNLLDHKHYSYTLEQLQKSKESGSIFKKRDKIAVRQVAPIVIKTDVPFLQEAYIPSRARSVLTIKEDRYEELEVDNEDQKKQEEEYAKENADLIDTNEIKPIVVVKG